ncbi:MAG: hypothetical protein JZU53_04955 [Paludibacter sp.]|nr:hypothetical protein [Paludibacter sp.]
MKEKLCILTLLFMGVLLGSCENDDFNYQSNFEKSYKVWLSFKSTSGNSYSYKVTQASVFGPASETTITVNDGKVTERHFKYTSTVGMINVPSDVLEWAENENGIGLHTYGAAALTLDQIYDKARSEWLIKRENAKVYLETNNNGLISSCGYQEDGCMDDCFIGIHISDIKPL